MLFSSFYLSQEGQTNVMQQQTCICLPQRIKNNNNNIRNNYKCQGLKLVIAGVYFVSTAEGV